MSNANKVVTRQTALRHLDPAPKVASMRVELDGTRGLATMAQSDLWSFVASGWSIHMAELDMVARGFGLYIDYPPRLGFSISRLYYSTVDTEQIVPAQPRVITPEEASHQIVRTVRHIAREWAKYPDKTPVERCEGVAFSILAMIDGANPGVPALNLVAHVSGDDQTHHFACGEDCFPSDVSLNADVALHEYFHGEDMTTEFGD